MKKRLIAILALGISLTGYGAYQAILNLAPTTTTVEKVVGASLVISQNNGTQGSSVIGVTPQVWSTVSGASVYSFAMSAPPVGPGQTVFVASGSQAAGTSLVMPLSFVFHSPSIYPYYGSSVQVGNQTITVSAIVNMLDGTTVYPTGTVITVNPLPIPGTQQSGAVPY